MLWYVRLLFQAYRESLCTAAYQTPPWIMNDHSSWVCHIPGWKFHHGIENQMNLEILAEYETISCSVTPVSIARHRIQSTFFNWKLIHHGEPPLVSIKSNHSNGVSFDYDYIISSYQLLIMECWVYLSLAQVCMQSKLQSTPYNWLPIRQYLTFSRDCATSLARH